MTDAVRRETPFDERAVLQELERLQDQIRMYKSKRQAVEETFDQFVGSFKRRDERLATTHAAGETPVASTSSVAPPVTGAVPPAHGPGSAASTMRPVAEDGDALAIEDMPAPLVRQRAVPRTRALLAAAVLIVAAAGSLLTWIFCNDRSGPVRPASDRAAAPVTAPTPPAAQPSPTPLTASPAESEITTTRRVWVRVLVDGNRVLERELPADTRVPLRAQETIVIRTGDAGAVRLSIAGRDQGFLGRTGEVVTRTINVPRAATR
jgi:hypothetical protein